MKGNQSCCGTVPVLISSVLKTIWQELGAERTRYRRLELADTSTRRTGRLRTHTPATERLLQSCLVGSQGQSGQPQERSPHDGVVDSDVHRKSLGPHPPTASRLRKSGDGFQFRIMYFSDRIYVLLLLYPHRGPTPPPQSIPRSVQ